MTKKSKKNKIPGTIYKNGNRYWWKVKLPGEEKTKARPLKPVGSSVATNDYNVAVECAKMIFSKAIFNSEHKNTGDIVTIAELSKAYLEYAQEYYKDCDGNRTRQPENIRYALKPLIDIFPSVKLEEFGPVDLNEVREEMLKSNLCRTTINKYVNLIRRMFKWGASKQYLSPLVYQGLCTLEGLKQGRTTAREPIPVKPIDEKYVYKVLPYLTPVVSAIVRLQLLTGMRPGEVLQIKPKDIDRSGKVWHYYPQRHKNFYRGQERVVAIGPKAQKILSPFLLRNDDSYCFSPAESEKYRRKKLTENRETPASYGNKVGSNRKKNPQTSPGNAYNSRSYAKAVRRAINAARKDIKANGGDPDKELPRWTPYQLRHTAATKTRKQFNYETAGALLGHSNMSATAIYAERNQNLADEVARKFG